MKDFNGKGVVVTGAASGIGLGIARAFADAGARVMIADIDADGARAAAGQLQSRGAQAIAAGCDVADRAAVEALADRAWSELGRVDVIVNNAGTIARPGRLIDASPDDFRWLLDVNLIGVWNGCSVFGRRFVDQGSPAHIVNTGSEHSLIPAHPGAGFYTATKHGVLAISDILRLELPEFIGVSILCPGIVRTNLGAGPARRPERYGGPVAGAGGAIDIGLDPDDVGRRVLAAVERGDFYIVTHSHVRQYVEQRYREILDAFDRQAPHAPGDEAYDMRRVMAARRASKGRPD
ncbi:MAG: SDR family NAD(P)-dependent oxidoreductase [Gammaproteobacteria bacterium]